MFVGRLFELDERPANGHRTAMNLFEFAEFRLVVLLWLKNSREESGQTCSRIDSPAGK